MPRLVPKEHVLVFFYYILKHRFIIGLCLCILKRIGILFEQATLKRNITFIVVSGRFNAAASSHLLGLET